MLLLMSTGIMAQLDTSGLWINLDSISISATRIDREWLKTAQAVTEVKLDDLKTNQQVSLQEVIKSVPGVFSLNQYNMAQDLRVSVRGFGSRARFGVRGIKLIVDGIPETTPDGQGQLDAIPLGLLSSIEVIRGSSSLLYGNASGGVLSLSTLSENSINLLAEPYLTARVLYGSFNNLQLQSTYANKIGGSSYLFHLSQSSGQGYRDQSAYLNRHVKARFDHRFSRYSKVNVMFDFLNSPKGQDPGALSSDDAAINRQQANGRNIDFRTGESLNQSKFSVSYSALTTPVNTLEIYGFWVKRSLDAHLPFLNGGILDLSRTHIGQGASYKISKLQETKIKTTIKYGYDIAYQSDERFRFRNDTITREDPLLDVEQDEIFKNVGIYAIAEIDCGDLVLDGGIRFDHNAIELKDSFFFDGDQSGEQELIDFNPSIGLSYELPGGAAIYLKASTGFETPSLIELNFNPNGRPGFNTRLVPQRSVNFDLGAKFQFDERLIAQANLFYITTNEELVAFEIDTLPGRTYYRNAGSTSRLGLELEAQYSPIKSLTIHGAYTYGRYQYDEYELDGTSLDGNLLPGLPQHLTYLSVDYKHSSGLTAHIDNQYIGQLYAEDHNQVANESTLLTNLNLSYLFKFDTHTIMPFFGINNLLNTTYNDNIRINAFGGNYFEPGPGIHFYGGIQFKL